MFRKAFSVVSTQAVTMLRTIGAKPKSRLGRTDLEIEVLGVALTQKYAELGVLVFQYGVVPEADRLMPSSVPGLSEGMQAIAQIRARRDVLIAKKAHEEELLRVSKVKQADV